jgi:hypothetical protein
VRLRSAACSKPGSQLDEFGLALKTLVAVVLKSYESAKIKVRPV